MTKIRDILIRGSEKVIDRYQLLLASAQTETEYLSRIEHEQRLLDKLKDGLPGRIAA